jgi:glycerol-3-phosphate dehydrogenase
MAAFVPPLREERLQALADQPAEVVVVGGGITGCGLALDLALRGVRTLVVERGDWACGTSSASSRLVHGGLRYLELYEFGMVRESCRERALLLRNAAGLVWPERFTFPVRRGDRVGRWKLAAGLGLYSLVSLPRALGWPSLVSSAEVARRVPGIASDGLRGGGSYLDGATDDARLTLAVVQTAMEAGAMAISRCEALGIEPGASGAAVRLRDLESGAELETSCRAVVLAGGPFTDQLRTRAGLPGDWVRPTRGTHVMVARDRLPTDGAVTLVSPIDGRVMFFLPRPRHTLIGTTDLDASADAPVEATHGEVKYLLDTANAIVPGARLVEDDVLSTWAGLRPLLAAPGKDPSARSREERIEREGPVWTIAGGKLTGYRSMAEELAARLVEALGTGSPGRASPTRAHRLRGSLANPVERPAWSSLDERGGAPALPDAVGIAHAVRYGADGGAVLASCHERVDGMRPLDEETLLGEVAWSVRHGDCLTTADFLLRRSDVGRGRPEDVAPRLELVHAALAAARGLDDAARARDRDAAEAALASLDAWRDGKRDSPQLAGE